MGAGGAGLATWQSGDIAPTQLATPLWVPQLLMPLGSLALLAALLGGTWRSAERLFGGAP